MFEKKTATIGVAGVTIPGALDCIHKIHRSSSLYYTTNEHPNVILYQPNFAVMQCALRSVDWVRVFQELLKSLEALATMGASFAVIPANTVHKVILKLQRECSIPVLNMLEVVSNECNTLGIKKVGVLGTAWTMSLHLYEDALRIHDIEEVIPSEDEQKIIHEAIFSELIPTGTVSSSTLATLLTVVESLKRRGCDGIALACTELPLVLNELNCGIHVIDTTGVLAKASLKRARGFSR